MAALIIEDPAWHNQERVYADRKEAGQVLASFLEPYGSADTLVLAIPSGGVAVGRVIARRLGLCFDIVLIRKIPIPGNTEAGFGALSIEGDVVLDESLVRQLGLSKEQVDQSIKPVARELRARNRIFRAQRPFLELYNQTIIIVDDGLASGYTMSMAIEVVRRKNPAKIFIAVPTAPARTIAALKDLVDMIICPNIRDGFSFAVAAAYQKWHDLDKSEVLELLRDVSWRQH